MTKPYRRRERYISVGAAVYQSPAFRSLPLSALRLWFSLRQMYNGSNNGLLRPTFSLMQRVGWRSKGELERGLATLIDRGFLRYTRKAGPNVYKRASCVAFTDISTTHNEGEGIAGCGPSNEFLSWVAPVEPTRKPPPRRDPSPGHGGKKSAIPRHEGLTALAMGASSPSPSGHGRVNKPSPSGHGKSAGKPRPALHAAESTPIAPRSPIAREVISSYQARAVDIAPLGSAVAVDSAPDSSLEVRAARTRSNP